MFVVGLLGYEITKLFDAEWPSRDCNYGRRIMMGGFFMVVICMLNFNGLFYCLSAVLYSPTSRCRRLSRELSRNQ